MRIKITGKHIDITDAIKTKIEEKLVKLPRYYDGIIDVEVIVEANEGGAAGSIEIISRAGGNHTFVAKHSDMDMYACIDEVIKKMEKQILKYKNKTRDDKHVDVPQQ